MHAPAQMTVAAAFDGPVDPALEHQPDDVTETTGHQRSGGGLEDVGAEAAAHAMLRLTADFPGLMGRLRTARIVGGYAVPHRDDADAARLSRYGIEIDWTLRELVRLVDALIDGHLLAQTSGPRPTLVLTRAGYAALVALEGGG
ncbi:MAG: hypothetical protein JWN72_604 [Thermoleophilia bacterium]|nr:hypothetical protein [Thermoleophilia bacterium]